MALAVSLSDREKDKFFEDGSGDVTIRLLGVTTSNTTNTMPTSKSGREQDKFVEDSSGDVAVYFSN